MAKKRKCGLAALPVARRREIQRMGILALWRSGKAHTFTKEEGMKGRAKQQEKQARKKAQGVPARIRGKNGPRAAHTPLWKIAEDVARERWKRAYKEALEEIQRTVVEGEDGDEPQ